MEVATVIPVFSEAECGFHDCRVHGFQWHRTQGLFVVHLQYIVRWIAPIEHSENYKFEIAEAELVFRGASQVVISFDWSRCENMVQIDDLVKIESRPAQSGVREHQYRIDFSNPHAFVTVWSTGFDVKLLHDPILCDCQYLPAVDQ
jgi:hypothetical protein